MAADKHRLMFSNKGTLFTGSFDGKKFDIDQRFKTDTNPSWITFGETPGGESRIFTVDEDSNKLHWYSFKKGKFAEDGNNTGSAGVVHLQFLQKDQLIGAGFGSSSIDVWETSSLSPDLKKTINIKDAVGPNKERQDKPHPHQIVAHPGGKYFVVNDLGTDSLLLYYWTIDLRDRMQVKPAGCGPRHGAFYPAKSAKPTHYIVLCEIMNLIKVYELDDSVAGLKFKGEVQSVSTFGDKEVPKNAAAGELLISGDGHLYVSNRLTEPAATDNIAHFTIDKKTAKLSFEGLTSTAGKLPRMFSKSADWKYLFVGNQAGDNGLVALSVGNDGKLGEKPVATVPMKEFGGQGPAFVTEYAAF